MKIYHDPFTGEVITKQEAINIAILRGKMLVEEEMTVEEAKKKGFIKNLED